VVHITVRELFMTFLRYVSYFSTSLAGSQCHLNITSWFLADEDIPTVDTTVAPTAILPHVPQFQGPLIRARACQLNYQVLSFLGTIPNIHENMMLPKSDVFMLLRNDGPSMDERDKHWSIITHGDDGNNRVRIQDDAASEDFRTLKPP
jgi:hypothetical protein